MTLSSRFQATLRRTEAAPTFLGTWNLELRVYFGNLVFETVVGGFFGYNHVVHMRFS